MIAVAALGSVLIVRWLNPEPVYQSRPLSEWLVQLRDSNPSNRFEAMTAVQAIGPEAVPRLTNELVRMPGGLQRLARAISDKIPERLKRVLRTIYNPSDEVVQKLMALQAIGMLGTNGTAAVPAVTAVLRTSEVGLSSAAAAALSNLGTNALPGLIPALDDGDFNIRANACYALRELGKNAAPAVPRLATIVAEERGAIVDVAFLTLSTIGEAAVPALTNLISDPDPSIRERAVRALGYIRQDARPALQSVIRLGADPSENVRAAAIQAIGMIDWVGEESGEALLGAIGDPAWKVREAAAKALVYRVGVVRSNLKKVCELLRDDSAAVRAEGARVIGQIGEHGRSAAPLLKALVTETNEAVRLNAMEALESVTGMSAGGRKIEQAGARKLEERSFQ